MIGLDRNSGKKVWGSKGSSAEAQYVSVMKGKVGSSELLRDGQQTRTAGIRYESQANCCSAMTLPATTSPSSPRRSSRMTTSCITPATTDPVVRY